ncbi:hypothetical protein ONZ51_g4438 [Trametes cubensis]|uniref:F-box domain-containing protein n=1 Tax=Trametes cubensis TaxID=1111947 RepID=A0AAD7TVT8_9APHY|nr:hypothetical protein ONZ51_g4438 [Trametes cubensis]
MADDQSNDKCVGSSLVASATLVTGNVSTLAVNSRPRKAARKWRGPLERLMELPLEVLYLVIESLELRDVLNLARIDKAFRNMLMSRRARPFWQAAIANTPGLPSCPPNMEEPQYAHLLFDNMCHGCGRGNTSKILFHWGVRYCKECLPPQRELAHLFKEVLQETGVAKPLYVTMDGQVHIREMEEFRQKWEALEGDGPGRKKLAEDNAKQVVLRRTHASTCNQWKANLGYARRAENKSIRAARLAAIKERLRGEGYTKELQVIGDAILAKQSFVNKPTPLTDRSWHAIRTDAIRFLEQEHTVKIRRVREGVVRPNVVMFLKVYDEWLQAWDPNWYDPGDLKAIHRMRPADFLVMDEVRLVVDAPAGCIVFPGNFEYARPKLLDMVVRWYAQQREALNDVFRDAYPALPQDTEPIGLAICSFDCSSPRCGGKFIHYPDILDHRCSMLRSTVTIKGSGYVNVIEESMARLSRPLPWQAQHVRVNERMVDHICELVRACGYDPLYASWQELDAQGQRMTCASCAAATDQETDLEVFDWRRAIHHQAEFMHRDRPCKWTMLPEEVAAKVRAFEARLREVPSRPWRQPFYRCKMKKSCWDVYDYDDLQAHARDAHGIREELQDEHYELCWHWHKTGNDLLHGTCVRFTRAGGVKVSSRYITVNDVQEGEEETAEVQDGDAKAGKLDEETCEEDMELDASAIFDQWISSDVFGECRGS